MFNNNLVNDCIDNLISTPRFKKYTDKSISTAAVKYCRTDDYLFSTIGVLMITCLVLLVY